MTTPTSTSLTSTSTALNAKRVVYVGGVAEDANETLLRAAFVPFGPIASVHVPMDYVKGHHRGFCFVEFLDADDAAEAIYNKHGAELLGRTLRVSLAQAHQLKSMHSSGTSNPANSAVWTSDEWFQQQNQKSDEAKIGTEEEQQQEQAMKEALRD